jgi:hypothetical protein
MSDSVLEISWYASKNYQIPDYRHQISAKFLMPGMD